MKLVILTTETYHHTYFVRELMKSYDDVHVILESQGVTPPFPVHHSFESDRDAYEREALFEGKDAKMGDYVKPVSFANINDVGSVELVRSINPDAIVVFGTTIIRKPLIGVAEGCIINLHGGDPEQYRGLDSHLWAIYHKDFDGLVTTIHHVNPTLDDGQVIFKSRVSITKNMKLHQLRKNNTDTCIQLTLDALQSFAENGVFPADPQKVVGRYYSFMPDVLKNICVQQFERYTATL